MANIAEGPAGLLSAAVAKWGRLLGFAASAVLIIAGLLTDGYLLIPGCALLAVTIVSIWWHSPIQSLSVPQGPLVHGDGGVPASGPGGELEMRRRGGTAMLGKSFEIIIDGETIGTLNRGQTTTAHLAAGSHVVQARTDTYASKPCLVEIRSGVESRVEVVASMRSMRRAMQDPTAAIDIAEVPHWV